MPPNNSVLAYRDLQEVADRAISNGRGVRVSCSTLGEAHVLRSRLYKMRELDRKENKKIYSDPDHALHGRSIYDPLILTPSQSEEGQIYLVVEVSTAERLEERIEEL